MIIWQHLLTILLQRVPPGPSPLKYGIQQATEHTDVDTTFTLGKILEVCLEIFKSTNTVIPHCIHMHLGCVYTILFLCSLQYFYVLWQT